jgi:membrane protein implicated in regulation of membrane protease activity
MNTSSIILLVISSAISFGLGRTFVHFRNKKRKEKAQARKAQALRDRPVAADSKNKSKRKRQIQQLDKEGGSQKH